MCRKKEKKRISRRRRLYRFEKEPTIRRDDAGKNMANFSRSIDDERKIRSCVLLCWCSQVNNNHLVPTFFFFDEEEIKIVIITGLDKQKNDFQNTSKCGDMVTTFFAQRVSNNEP